MVFQKNQIVLIIGLTLVSNTTFPAWFSRNKNQDGKASENKKKEEEDLKKAAQIAIAGNKSIKSAGKPPKANCDNCTDEKKENIKSEQDKREAEKKSRPLNIKDFEAALNALPNKSQHACARLVRLNLTTLFNGIHIDHWPVPAKDYDIDVLKQWNNASSCYHLQDPDTREPFLNFDVRVLEKADKNAFGHIEIYYNGTWYSDFKQRTSEWNSGRYINKNLYRLSKCSQSSFIKHQLLELIKSHILQEANAEDTINTASKMLVAQKQDSSFTKEFLLAQSGEWSIKEIEVREGSDYFLYKKGVVVSQDSNNIFSLIHDIKDKKLQMDLAKDSIKKQIKTNGREAVQKLILRLEAFTELQKNLYIQEGFKLPAKYSIYLK